MYVYVWNSGSHTYICRWEMYVKKVYVCGEMYVGKCIWENVCMWENVIICGKMYVGKCRAMYVKDVCGEINVGEKCLNV